MPRPVHVLVVAVMLAGCVQASSPQASGGTGEDPAGPSTTTTLGRLGLEQVTLEFGSCMRQRGISTPDLRLDAQSRPILDELRASVDTSTEEFRRALTECAPILTRAGALDLRRDPELQAVIVAQLQAFAECVRDEGLDDFPDPDPAFSGIGSPFPSEEVPFTDPAFDEAVRSCQESLAQVDLNQE